MHRSRSTTYDRIEVPKTSELLEMYLKQGMDLPEATEKANEIHRAMDDMGRSEARFWKKVRTNEQTAGLEPELPKEGVI